MTRLISDHLYWLRARERISFKLCILVYKAIHGLTPWYLNETCIPVSVVLNLSAVRSAARGDLVVPRTRLQLGNLAFCVAGTVAWTVYHWKFVRHLGYIICCRLAVYSYVVVVLVCLAFFKIYFSFYSLYFIVLHVHGYIRCVINKYIINVQKHAQDTSFLTFLLY